MDIPPVLFWPPCKLDGFFFWSVNLFWTSFLGFSGLWTGKWTSANRLSFPFPYRGDSQQPPILWKSHEVSLSGARSVGANFPLWQHSLCLFCLRETHRVDTCLTPMATLSRPLAHLEPGHAHGAEPVLLEPDPFPDLKDPELDSGKDWQEQRRSGHHLQLRPLINSQGGGRPPDLTTSAYEIIWGSH